MINFYFFTIGTCIASFLGLVVDRFPNQSILAPRSHCDHCSTSLEFGISSPLSRNYSIAFAVATVISPTHFGTAFLRFGVACSF